MTGRPRRHVRLELPGGPRHLERRVLSGAAAARIRRAALLRRALRHRRGELDLLSRARRRHRRGAGSSARREASCSRVKLYQKFTHPDMYLARNGVSRLGPLARRLRRVPRAGIEPLADAGRLGALLSSFRRASTPRPERAATWTGCSPRLRGLSARRRAAPPHVERRRAPTRAARLAAAPRGLGVHRRAEVPGLDRRQRRSADRTSRGAARTSACTAATPPHGGTTTRPRTGTTISTRAPSSRPFADAARTRRRLGPPRAHVPEQPLLGQGRRQRRGAQARAGQAVPGRYPPEMVARYPELAGVVGYFGPSPLT